MRTGIEQSAMRRLRGSTDKMKWLVSVITLFLSRARGNLRFLLALELLVDPLQLKIGLWSENKSGWR